MPIDTAEAVKNREAKPPLMAQIVKIEEGPDGVLIRPDPKVEAALKDSD